MKSASFTKQRFASLSASVVFRTLARVAALVWLLPALLFNVDWTGHSSWQANAAAIIMILGSALFIEGALRLKSLTLTPLCALAAIFLVFVNTKQATRTLSFASEAASEARQAQITTASHLASQRSQLLARREAQSGVAGEQAAATLETALEAIKISEPKRWRQTDGCTPEKVTSSVEFCTRVAQAKEKLAAARERDKIDGQLAKLAPAATGSDQGPRHAPQVADAYVANIGSLLSTAGVQVTPEVKRLIAAEEALSRALGFELLAALGPTCWNAFIDWLLGIGGRVSRRRIRLFGRRRVKVGGTEQEPESDPRIDRASLERWAADALEEAVAGESMRSGDLRQSYHGWCVVKDEKPVTDRALWGFLGSRFTSDPVAKRNGRPRYMGVRPKRVKPDLRVAA